MQLVQVKQGTDDWLLARVGLATASQFSLLITGTGKPSASLEGYAATLAADKYAGRPLERWTGNAATERGHELEPIARANYEFVHGVSVEQVGFITNFGAGCSPDGLVGADGLHEIKNQMPKGHVETLAYYSRHKSCPPGYMPQVQGQLLICEREWCDLDFFSEDLPTLTVRIGRDEDYIACLLEQIERVNEKRDEYLQMLRGMA